VHAAGPDGPAVSLVGVTMLRSISRSALALLLCGSMLTPAFAVAPDAMKQDAAANIDSHAKLVQEMVDTVFSYGEPGFQEFRTGDYLTAILAKNGFKITRGVAGIPSFWTATWGDGGPLIALGSDEDDLRGVSQIPGDPKIEPIVNGAPGHGEGHNTGMPLIIAAALAIKDEMVKNHIKGRLMLWPGIAEELLGAKAFYVRDGVFKGVDACIFVHVASTFGTFYGNGPMNGMVSVEYTFHGKTADAAAMATDTTVEHKLLGFAAPNFGNKPMAELAYANIKMVGMPKWTADDQAFAKMVQQTQNFKIQPLPDQIPAFNMMAPQNERMPTGGGSDDIGDIMWTVPTISIFYPSNIPNTIGHNVTSAMAEATPIAHKGAVAGAKAVAFTVLDLMTTPDKLAEARKYFDTDQQQFDHYQPLLSATDVPAIHLNDDYMRTYRPLMEPYYYDAKKYPSYLDQLGIHYPNPPTGPLRKITPPLPPLKPAGESSSGGG
jgi:metal-dependent amidase/aminoacylase/carboxypeptidase family protein